jgi:hypothetical protein
MVFEEHLKHSVMKSTFQKLFSNHVDHNMSREVVPSYYNTIKNTNETASTVVVFKSLKVKCSCRALAF